MRNNILKADEIDITYIWKGMHEKCYLGPAVLALHVISLATIYFKSMEMKLYKSLNEVNSDRNKFQPLMEIMKKRSSFISSICRNMRKSF